MDQINRDDFDIDDPLWVRLMFPLLDLLLLGIVVALVWLLSYLGESGLTTNVENCERSSAPRCSRSATSSRPCTTASTRW